MNVGSSCEISIKELANMIKDIVGFKGDVLFDKLKLEYDRTEKSKAPSFTKGFLSNHPHPTVKLIAKAREISTKIDWPCELKTLFRDTVVVYISVVVGYYTLKQISSDIVDNSSPEVFTGNPGF